jgi:FlaA1/EpsC-like NDP-sugar epimerase
VRQHPNGVIEIEYTTCDQRRNSAEELLIGANAVRTEHPMIPRATELSLLWPEMHGLLDEIQSAVENHDCQRAQLLLARAVREYHPSDTLHDLVWSQGRIAAELRASNGRRLRVVGPGDRSA